MNARFLLLTLLPLCLLSCDQVKAPSGSNAKTYVPTLEEGLTNLFGYSPMPQGQVTIMSAFSSSMEPVNAEAMRFPINYLDFLNRAESDGLVQLTEKQQNSLEQIGNMGARFFTVTATEKLKGMIDPVKSNDKWLQIPASNIKVLEVMSEEPCKLHRATPGDEFRLVIGRIKDTPSEQIKQLGSYYATTEPQELKFRSILQFNPFTKTYFFVTADLGILHESTWISQNVANLIEG